MGNKKDSLKVTLICSKRLLRVNRSVTIIAQIQEDETDVRDYTFRWRADEGEIKQTGPGNKALYTTPGRKCTVEVAVEVKDKNNAVATQAVSLIVYKQLGFLKADDLLFSPVHTIYPGWQTFLDYMAEKQIKTCVGLICNSLEKGNADYIDRLKKLARRNCFELFNHGYDHVLGQVNEDGETYSEFFNTSFSQQKEHFLKAQNLAKEKLNITLHTFGAPGNAIDKNTTRAIETVKDLKAWLLGDTSSSKLVLRKRVKVENSSLKPDYDAFVEGYDPAADYYVLQIHPKNWSSDNFGVFKKILDFLNQKEMTFLLPYEYYQLTYETPMPSEIVLSRSTFNFGCDRDGRCTPSQVMRIKNNGGGILNWTAVGQPTWINIGPSSGAGAAAVSISINSAGLKAGTYHGVVTVKDPNAVNSPRTAAVNLKVFDSGTTSPPFGDFSTPVDKSTVCGSIPVTGWVLDDIHVESVKIYSGRAYIGEAVFVEGARPDVGAAYPGVPQNYRAGWGYMLLTNCLPGGGNGGYTLNVFAVDSEGNRVKLGSKTITVDNKNAVKPFGAIDTPAPGGTASGSKFVNYGWALTPMPNKIPENGSTIRVFVDGVDVGKPVYNVYRSDIAELFPGYANSGGASGYFVLDTTAYENGIHTIAWVVTDSAGNAEGIGSRYFIIDNIGKKDAPKVDAFGVCPECR